MVIPRIPIILLLQYAIMCSFYCLPVLRPGEPMEFDNRVSGCREKYGTTSSFRGNKILKPGILRKEERGNVVTGVRTTKISIS